jgi:putative NADPH-quinone reductase
MLRILIVVANPGRKSLCRALADVCAATLRSLGHSVSFHDLYAEKFEPVLPADELPRNSRPGRVLARHCRELREADGIVVVHPNWWGQPPAVLKGWIDRVFRPGVAYRFRENDRGEGVPVGLLKAGFALVLNTSNTRKRREKETFGDPLDTIWKNCVFGLCGVRNVIRRTYGVVVTSSPRQRKAWLRDAERIVRKTAGGTGNHG